jgi:hypothetical protein
MTNTQAEHSTSDAVFTSKLRLDRGPWHGLPARTATFVASLAIAAGGGWFGYSHGEELSRHQRAEAIPGSVQAEANHGFGIEVDTAAVALFSFLGSEITISYVLVSMQQRYELKHSNKLSDDPTGQI